MKNILEIRNLSHAYDQDISIIKDFSFSLKKNKPIACVFCSVSAPYEKPLVVCRFHRTDFRHLFHSVLCFRVVFLSRFKKKLKKKKTKKESLIACCSSTAATALLVSHRFHRKKNSCESILSDKISSGKCVPRTKSQFCSHSYS